MKSFRLFCILACCLCSVAAHAQVRGTTKRGAVHVFVRLSGDLHLNGVDEVNRDSHYDGLQTKDKMGCGLGLEFQRMTRSRLYFAGGAQIKVVPQEIAMLYDPAKTGFGSGAPIKESFSFTNVYTALVFHFGYSALLTPRSAFDVDAGFNFLIPTNGRQDRKRYYAHITSPDYTDMVLNRNTVWGYNSPLGLISLRMAYRGYQGMLFGDRSFRVGLESMILFSDNYKSRSNNGTEFQYYGPNRQPLGKQYFYDRHLGLSLFFDVEL